jgi:EAL domain-containing protein (putative c-di-GMP-specific phosphodiesterase class I)
LGGQRAGDRLLVLAASKLRDLQPRPASIGRLGSDDFAVFFTDIPPVQAIQVARLINAGFRMDADTRGSDELSACSGLALCPNHSRDAQELLSFANLALIQAKTKGRGSWHMYSPEELLREQALSKAQTVSLIDRALARDGFELHFQPIVSLTDKPSSHFEALVRMRDEHGSMVFPGLFIPVAEQTGQIRNIDRWVIRRAIKELAQQSEQLCLAVNLSGRSLGDSGLVNEIRQSLADSKVGPHRLILEITETTALAEIDAARELLSSLHELGCTIALDDFGVGFSSFQYLKQLPVDYVKIDGSFIRGLDKNEDDRVFVRALNEAVHGYGKRTIAEFVENAEILRLLKEYGVDFAQGYHLGKPRPELIYSSAGIFRKRA